jgi:hypothetical protein
LCASPDPEGSDEIKPQRIAEAMGYRSLDGSVGMGEITAKSGDARRNQVTLLGPLF